MQEVSAAWKAAQLKTTTPKQVVKVDYSVSQTDSTPTVSADYADANYSNLNDLYQQKNNFNRYASLEQNFIELAEDSGIKFAEEFDDVKVGYTCNSDSGYNASLGSVIYIRYNYSSVQTENLDNLSIIWSDAFPDSFAVDFTIRFKNNGVTIKTVTVTDNRNNVSLVEVNASNYDEIDIIPNKWSLTYVKPRVQLIFPGTVIRFEDQEIITLSHAESFDPLSFSLPTSQVVFDIDNIDKKWNPENPSGLYQYLATRQKVNVQYGFDFRGNYEMIAGGVFFLSEWETPQNGITAKFTAKGLIDFMDVDFSVSALATSVGETEIPFDCKLTDIVKSAFAQCGIPSTQYVLTGLTANDQTITVNTEYGCKCSHALQYAANALMAIVYSDRTGKINVKAWDKTVPSLDTSYSITQENSYSNAEYERTKDIKAVMINGDLGGYDSGKTSGEIQTLENPFIQSQAHAESVSAWVYSWLSSIRLVSGEYRADPRLDIGDEISLETRYATSDMIVTEYQYTFNGIVDGNYKGRII